MRGFTQSVQNRFSGRRLLVLALALSSLAAAGCSTPAVYGDDSEAANEAYDNCLSSLPLNESAAACNNVGNGNAASLTNYSTSGEYVDSNGNIVTGTSAAGSSGPSYSVKTSLNKSVSLNAEVVTAYKAYLSTREASDLKTMTAQWKTIAAQNTAAKQTN